MKKTTLLMVLLFAMTSAIFAQTLTGTVNAEDGPLPGANVIVKGTETGTQTDFDGKFSLNVTAGSGTLVISFVGYANEEIAYTITAGETKDLGTVTMVSDNTLEEVVITTSLIDLAKDRQTPVAVSTVTAAEITTELGSQEFPEILNNTPSVYATKSGGGFGDARVNIRGFSQENIAVMINGVPVNDMENGRVFWSNWAGLSDVTTAMQVQRGLGSSKLAISSVGGTVNVITKTTEKEQGGVVAGTVGNAGYLKTLASYSTGLMENGFATSVLLSRTAGDGYVRGSEFEGYNYFLSFGWDKGGDHNIQFTITGAPQAHNQRTTSFFNMATLEDYVQYGDKYNYNHGYKNGEEFGWRKNFYHKPIAFVNWDWDISDNMSLSTSAYVSFGRGGGTGDIGRLGGNFASSSRFRDPSTGEVLWDEIVDSNSGQGGEFNRGFTYNNVLDPTTGLYIVNDDELRSDDLPAGLERRNGFIRRASVNSHNWYGILANLNTQLSENLTLDTGIDLRSYKGIHYRRIDDLLGADGYRDNDNINEPLNVLTTEYSSDVSSLWNVFRSTDDEEKINYYNDGLVRWAGVFAQLEYTNDVVSAFIQAAASNQGFKRVDYFNYLDSDPNQETDWENIFGGNIKGGINWNIDENHNVYANAGYYSKQPFFDAVYINFVNDLNEDYANEKILGTEIGYGFRSPKVRANINLYRTSWKDRFVRFSDTFDDNGVDIQGVANVTGVEQIHTGVEFDLNWKASETLRFLGMVSVGNWEYGSTVTATYFDENTDPIIIDGEQQVETLYLDGVKVGDAAQFTARLGLQWKAFKNFRFDLSQRYIDKLYARVNAEDFNREDNMGSLKLPGYAIMDGGVSYRVSFGESMLNLRFNVNNLADTEYIAESATNYFPGRFGQDETYKGVNVDNKVFFGWGRTFNMSARLTF
ncbi:MAG: TonB-dependent receptor [Flavobacteriaceae bacterium]|nr:TonB-dependent receptor [Flavobacteriaceae bacterium]